MTEPTVIRVSALTSYPDCNRRGAARLFWREIRAAGFVLRRTSRSIGAAIGSAVHAAAEITLKEKAKTGELPPVTVATDIAAESLAEALAQGEIAYDSSGPTYSRNDAAKQAIGMTRAYHRMVAPSIRPILVEQRLEAEVVPGLVLSGQADVIAREPHAVRDLKTGRRPSNHAPQLGGYSLLSRSHGFDIEEASIDFIRRVPPDKVQPDPISQSVKVTVAETAATRILSRINDDLETFRHGDPAKGILPGDKWSFVANPASNLCAEKWCPCWGVTGPHAFCDEWQVTNRKEEHGYGEK